MLQGLLKNNRTSGIILIFLLMVLIWLKAFINPAQYDDISSMPLYDLLFAYFRNRQIASVLMSMAYYAVLMVLLIRLNVVHYMLEDRSYMPASFFLLISASFPSVLQINPILVSSLFLILAILMLIKGDEHRANPMALFNSSLLIAVGSLFYLKLIWFIPFLWITGAIIRPLKWRGLVNPIIVLLMMALFYTSYFWVFKNDLSLFHSLLAENLSIEGKFPGFSMAEWILLGYLFILILISSFYLLNRIQVKKIIIRKIYQVLFILFIYSAIFYLLVSGFKTQALSFLAIPLSYLFANYFHRKKTHWIHDLLLWIWVLLIAYEQITNQIN